MQKLGAYLSMAGIVLFLAASDAYLLTRSSTLSRIAREEIERLGEGKLEVLDVTASLDGVVTLDGVRIHLGGPAFKPQEADRVVLEFRGRPPVGLGPVRRVTFEGVRLNVSRELVDELAKGESKKTIRDLFPNPDDVPQVVVRGGRLDASLPDVFPGGPQSLLLRTCTLTPDLNYRAHVQGLFESPIYGRWSAKGYIEPDRGAFGLTLEAAFLLIEPRMREPLAPRLKNIYEKYLPGGTCDLTVELGKEPGAELDFKATLHARDMQFNYRNFPYQVDKASGEIDFFKNRFHVKHMAGEHGDARIRLSGEAGGYPVESSHHFRLEMENVPLDADLRAALREGSRKALDRFSPSGRVNARATVTREAGADKTARIPVEITANGVSLAFREFPYELRNVTGELRVDGEEIAIRRLVSRDGETAVAVTGAIRDLTGDATADVEIEARGVPLDDRLKRAVGDEVRKTWDLLSPGGTIDARWRLLKEKGRGLTWAGTIRARGNTVRHADFPVAVSELEGEIEVVPGRVGLRRLTGKAHGARVGAHGTIGGDSVEMDIDATGLVIDDALKAALPAEAGDLLKELKLGGVVGFMAGYKSRKDGQKQFTVDLRLSKGVLDTEPRIEEAEGHVALEGFHDKEFFLRGPISFSTATIAGKRVTDVGASLNVKGHRVNLVNIKATSYGGLLAGKSFSIDTKTGHFYCESLTVDRLDLREFALDTAGYAKKTLGGRASLSIQDLAGKAADAKTITGKGRLAIRDGLLWDVPVFVSLFTLNPQELFKSRQQFDTGAIDFEVKERRFAIEKLSFSSEGVSVFGRGTVDFDGNLDLVLKTKTGFFGIDFLPINLVTGLFDELKGAFHGVAVTGTFEKPETSQKFFPGILK